MSARLCIALSLLAAPSAPQPAAAPSGNPFFSEWTTPFGVPPFDQIRTEHFLPAIEEGIAQHGREVAAIAKSPAPPTFANTVEALDASGRLLEKVTSVFSNLTSAETSDALQAIQKQVAPMMAAHRDDIRLDPALFQRVKAVWDGGPGSPSTPTRRSCSRTPGRTSCAAARSFRRRARSGCARSTASSPPRR